MTLAVPIFQDILKLLRRNHIQLTIDVFRYDGGSTTAEGANNVLFQCHSPHNFFYLASVKPVHMLLDQLIGVICQQRGQMPHTQE